MNKASEWDKQKIVKEFLLLPIKVKRKSEILIGDNNILTGQKYLRHKDPDMSNIAVEFYKIIYDFNDKEDIINSKGRLIDKEFAGDTMCSYNTIKNSVHKVVTKDKTKDTILSKYLEWYHKHYHCLANFWILPMKEGRTLSGKYKKGVIDDYMDRYLDNLNNIYCNGFKSKYPSYTNKFIIFNDFCKKHFLNGSYIKNNEIISFSNNENLADRFETMKKLIEERADCISKSKYCDQLFELYSRYRKNLSEDVELKSHRTFGKI